MKRLLKFLLTFAVILLCFLGLGFTAQAETATNQCSSGGGGMPMMSGGGCGMGPMMSEGGGCGMGPMMSGGGGGRLEAPSAGQLPGGDLPPISAEPIVKNASLLVNFTVTSDVAAPDTQAQTQATNQAGFRRSPVTIPAAVPAPTMQLVPVTRLEPIYVTPAAPAVLPKSGTVTTQRNLGLLGLRGTVTEQWQF